MIADRLGKRVQTAGFFVSWIIPIDFALLLGIIFLKNTKSGLLTKHMR